MSHPLSGLLQPEKTELRFQAAIFSCPCIARCGTVMLKEVTFNED